MGRFGVLLVFVVVVGAEFSESANAGRAPCSTEGKIRVHPGNCAKFDTCNFGSFVTRDCPPGTIYSEPLHVCVFGACGPRAEAIEEQEEIQELPEPEVEPKECPNVKKADIMVVVDQSTSVGKSGWKSQLEFLTKVVAGLPIGPNAVQVGLIKFSTEAELMFKMDECKDIETLKKKINSLKYEGGVTFTHKALALAGQYLTKANGARPKTQKVVIVLTDGASNEPGKTIAAAEKIHAMKVKVLAIGVGNTRADELKAMAKDEKFVLHTNNMAELVEQDFIEKKVLDSIKCITKCTPVQVADVVFLVDLSASIREDGFEKEKFFIKAVINSLDIDKTKVRVGLVTFSNAVKEIIDFTRDQKKSGLLQQVDHIRWMNSITNTHLGLKDARTEMFTSKKGSRKGVPHVLVVLTDGASTEEDQTIAEAKKVKAAGTKVIAIGVGNKVKMKELEAVASDKRFVLLAKDFKALKNLNFIKNEVIQSMSCVALEEPTLDSHKDLNMFI